MRGVPADYLTRVRRRVRAGGPRARTGPTWWPGSRGTRQRGRRVAGVRRAHRRGAVRPARLDAPAVRGGARRRRLALGPRRGRHEERGGGARRRDGRAGPVAASGRAATCGSSRSPTRRTGSPTSGCAGCSRSAPTSGPTHSINEGGGERLPLSDGRQVVGLSVGEKGTLPGAGHRASARPATRPCRRWATTPYPCSRELLAAPRRRACPSRRSPPDGRPRCSRCCSGATSPTCARALAEAEALHPSLGELDHGADGLDDGADACCAGSNKRNVMPARATVEVDCRILPGHHRGRRRGRRCARCSATTSPTSSSGPRLIAGVALAAGRSAVPTAIAAFLAADGDPATVLPTLCTGFTDSNYLRAAGRHRGVRLQPLPRHPDRGARRRLPQRRRAGPRRRPAAVDALPRRPRQACAGVTRRLRIGHQPQISGPETCSF